MKKQNSIEVVCDVCGAIYKANVKQWKYAEKHNIKHCCSRNCITKLNMNGKNVKCLCCGKIFYRQRKDFRDDNVYYCSLECAHKCINHSHICSDITKKKISDSVKNFYNKNKNKKSLIRKICPICNNEFFVYFSNRNKIYCSRKCYVGDYSFRFRKKVSGGVRIGSSRGKKGWYKGYWCDSSWELAYVIYNLEHGIKFERNKEGFEYWYLGKKHKFYPDFILEDGTYVEIKGVMTEQNLVKVNTFNGFLNVLDKLKMKSYIEYAELKYGKDYTRLYEK